MIAERRLDFLLWSLTVLALSLFNGRALARTQTFIGKAFDETGTLEYVEKHDVVYEGNSVLTSHTTYLGPDKSVIGYLHSEYTPLPQFCSYIFKDLRRRYEDGVRLKKDRVCLFRKVAPRTQEETLCLPKEEKQIIGQGFHHFIRSHLVSIAEGEVFHVKLVLPSRLDQAGFRILKKKTEGNYLLIRLEIDNWLIRLFAPYMDVVYERESGRLMSYEGISNVADASGRFKKVKINYSYKAFDHD
jgi:hypothetical protein